LAERAHRAKYEAECDPANEKRDSDLCAQWKAADAAAKAAKWAKIAAWLGGISGLLVIAALFLAFQSNSIARQTAKRQLRAYVGIEWIGVSGFVVGETPSSEIRAKNFGQTPAHHCDIFSFMALGVEGDEDALKMPTAEEHSAFLAPGAASYGYPTLGRKWTQENAKAFGEGLLNAYVSGLNTLGSASLTALCAVRAGIGVTRKSA
jgi:hypothetical protein